MRAIRLWGNKKLRFALIGVAVAVLVGLVLAWLMWPGPDLTLRLKLVRSEVVDGKSKLLFRVEGAEKYEIDTSSCLYLTGNDSLPSHSAFDFWNLAYDSKKGEREFYADPPPNNHQAYKLYAAVVIHRKESLPSKLSRVVKETWEVRRMHPKLYLFTVAKSRWHSDTDYAKIVSSDLITNTPPH